MEISIKNIISWLKNNYPVFATIGAILLILNYTGFNVNIFAYYNSLDLEGRLKFLSFANFIITLVLFLFLFEKIGKIKSK